MKKLIILLMSLTLVLTACNNTPTRTVTNNTSKQSQVEDCDADDLLEGDEDCYGVDLKKKKKHKTTSSVTQIKKKVNTVNKKTIKFKSKTKSYSKKLTKTPTKSKSVWGSSNKSSNKSSGFSSGFKSKSSSSKRR